MVCHSGRIWQFLVELNIDLPHDPAIMPSGIHPSELKTHLHKNCMQMFIGALFIIAKTGKQTSLSLNMEMDKQTAIHSYNEIIFRDKNAGLLIHATWMSLKCYLLSKRSQTPSLHLAGFHSFGTQETAKPQGQHRAEHARSW